MDGIRRYAGIDWAKDAHAVCIIDERGSALGPLRGRAQRRRPAGARPPAHRGRGRGHRAPRRAGGRGAARGRPAGGGHRVPPRQGPAHPPRPGGQQGRPRRCVHPRRALRTEASASGRCIRMPPRRWPCGRRCGPARTSSIIGPRSDSSWRPTWRSPSPGAVDLFDELASPIARAFLRRFPSAERAAWLGPRRFDHWLAAQGYSGRRAAPSSTPVSWPHQQGSAGRPPRPWRR